MFAPRTPTFVSGTASGSARRVGASTGVRGLVGKARSSVDTAAIHAAEYARGRGGGMIGRSIGALAKHPGMTGIGLGSAVGYGAYRHHRRGSQNRAIGSSPMDQ